MAKTYEKLIERSDEILVEVETKEIRKRHSIPELQHKKELLEEELVEVNSLLSEARALNIRNA